MMVLIEHYDTFKNVKNIGSTNRELCSIVFPKTIVKKLNCAFKCLQLWNQAIL